MTSRTMPTLAMVEVAILHVVLKKDLAVARARPEDQPAPAPRLEQAGRFIAKATLNFLLFTHT
jgi:hypothetical protein